MNIINYLKNYLYTFDEQPMNEVDSLILSQFSYLHLVEEDIGNIVGTTLKDINKSEYYKQYFKGLWDEVNSEKMFMYMCASKRFRDIRLLDYISEIDKESTQQCSAVTFKLNHSDLYIAFRGTDGTLVGWKEDLLLTVSDPIASQIKALEYLNHIMKYHLGRYYVGGHSKGGNLAVYASAMANEPERIIHVFSHDGPGFKKEKLALKQFIDIRSKIKKTVPQSSIIGLLMGQETDYKIIQSNGFSINQHDPFTWLIDDNHFIECNQITPDASIITDALTNWEADITDEQKIIFIETLFDILYKTDANTFGEFSAHLKDHMPMITQEISSLDKTTRNLIIKIILQLASTTSESIQDYVKDKVFD